MAALGMIEEAVSSFLEAFRLYADVRAELPESKSFEEAWARSHSNLTSWIQSLEQPEMAVAAYQDLTQILERTVQRYPEVILHREQLAKGYFQLDLLLGGKLKRHEDAAAAARKSIALYQQLGPMNPGFQFELGRAHNNLAVRLAALEKTEESIASLLEASKDNDAAASIRTSTISPSRTVLSELRYPGNPGVQRLSAATGTEDVMARIVIPNKKPIFNIFMRALLR